MEHPDAFDNTLLDHSLIQARAKIQQARHLGCQVVWDYGQSVNHNDVICRSKDKITTQLGMACLKTALASAVRTCVYLEQFKAH